MSQETWDKKNSEAGEFIRDESEFRDWVRSDGSTPYRPEPGRYHLYVSHACPWASRTMIARTICGLEDAIGVSVVSPLWNRAGWCFDEFPGVIPDSVNHKHDLIDLYRLARPGYDAEETVPVLWDKAEKTIVNNESREILRMFTTEFRKVSEPRVELAPEESRGKIDETIDAIYEAVNNGVYRSGFATTQSAYERAVKELFAALDHWDGVLASQDYLCGDRLTEADICMYTTLVRFDAVYYSHFKCNLRRIVDYPNLWPYLRRLYATEGFAANTHMDHIKTHYFGCHRSLNPTGIIPLGPEIDFTG